MTRINMEFSQEWLNLIANALADRPYREVADLISDMQRQVSQINAAANVKSKTAPVNDIDKPMQPYGMA